MKVQISTLLAWEVGEQCRKFLESKDPLSWESSEIKKRLFKLYDPMDPRLRSCLSKGYYSTYFEDLYKTQAKCDPSEAIVDDTPFYCAAPYELQGYLWGASLMAHYKYDPDQEKNCRMFEKYAAKFGTTPFVEYFRKSTICKKVEKKPLQIIDPFDADLFTLINFSFPGKRLYIDLWATWCAPCKAEFKHYDSSFYQFMKEKKVILVYLSIDKQSDKKRWEGDVNRFNLAGFHLLAGPKLQSSIKDVVFDGGNAAIPRYILVSEDGRILSTDFKRPSDPRFKTEIEEFFR
jgi:thiol-disulfide isomerase/thioredoxin